MGFAHPKATSKQMWFLFSAMSLMGHSRHCRCGPKSAFVRSTPLATVLGVVPPGRDVPKTEPLEIIEFPQVASNVEMNKATPGHRRF